MTVIDINAIAAKVAAQIEVKAAHNWENFVSEDGMEINVDAGELFVQAFDDEVAQSEFSGQDREKLAEFLFVHHRVISAMNEADFIVREAAEDTASWRKSQTSGEAQLRAVGMSYRDFV